MSISSRHSLAVAAVALAACASTLGLDATRVDTDRDGVSDADDNCPTVYNPDQADRDGVPPGDACDTCPADRATHRDLDGDGIDDGCDLCIGPGPTGQDVDGDGIDDGCDPCIAGVSVYDVDDDHDGIADGCDTCVGYIGVDIDRDGIDDACDHCLAGPPDDQDGDGIEDSCDLCPTVADAPDLNTTDRDAIGDRCDPYPTTDDVRVVFDGFREKDLSKWTSDAQWTVANDVLTYHLSPTGTAETNYVSAAPLFAPYFLATRVTPAGASFAGVVAVLDVNTAVTCEIDATGFLSLDDGNNFQGMRADPTSPFVLVVTATTVQPGVTGFTCEVRTANYLAPGTPVLALQTSAFGTWHLELLGRDGAAYDWVEAIQGFFGI